MLTAEAGLAMWDGGRILRIVLWSRGGDVICGMTLETGGQRTDNSQYLITLLLLGLTLNTLWPLQSRGRLQFPNFSTRMTVIV